MTNDQIARMLQITDIVEIDSSNFNRLEIASGNIAEMPDELVVIDAEFEDDKGLIYGEIITVGALRNGVVDDDILKLADGRSLRFLKTRVIEWEEFDQCAS